MTRFAIALLALLAGCAVPATQTAVMPVAAPALGLTGAAVAVADDWWRGFGDPQLDRLVADATDGNPTFAVALRGWRRRRRCCPPIAPKSGRA